MSYFALQAFTSRTPSAREDYTEQDRISAKHVDF